MPGEAGLITTQLLREPWGSTVEGPRGYRPRRLRRSTSQCSCRPLTAADGKIMIRRLSFTAIVLALGLAGCGSSKPQLIRHRGLRSAVTRIRTPPRWHSSPASGRSSPSPRTPARAFTTFDRAIYAPYQQGAFNAAKPNRAVLASAGQTAAGGGRGDPRGRPGDDRKPPARRAQGADGEPRRGLPGRACEAQVRATSISAKSRPQRWRSPRSGARRSSAGLSIPG